MIFIYPVGIPTMYFYLLYHARHMVQLRKQERRAKEEKLREEELAKKTSTLQMKLYLAGLKVVQSDVSGYVEGDPSPYQSNKDTHSNKQSNNDSINNSSHDIAPTTTNPMINPSDHTTLPLRQTSPLHSPLAVNRPSTLSSAIRASRANSSANSAANSRTNSPRGDGSTAPPAAEGATNVMDLLSNEIGFLHNAYRGSCWYWEVVEACRKLLLTAVLSIVATGQSAQIVFAICVIVIFMVASYVEPHFYHEDDFLGELTNYGILLVLFISLLLRTNAMGDDWLKGMDAVIILLVAIPVAVAILTAADGPGYVTPSDHHLLTLSTHLTRLTHSLNTSYRYPYSSLSSSVTSVVSWLVAKSLVPTHHMMLILTEGERTRARLILLITSQQGVEREIVLVLPHRDPGMGMVTAIVT